LKTTGCNTFLRYVLFNPDKILTGNQARNSTASVVGGIALLYLKFVICDILNKVELVKTVKCKLEVREGIKPVLHDTLIKFSKACNDILKVSIENKTSNKVKIQHLCYREVKEKYSLPANLVIRAIARVCASRKSKRPIKEFRPTSIEYDARTFSLKFIGGYYFTSLSTAQGRIKNIRLSIGNYQLGLLKGRDPTSWRGKFVDFDLGINCTATASNKVKFRVKNLI